MIHCKAGWIYRARLPPCVLFVAASFARRLHRRKITSAFIRLHIGYISVLQSSTVRQNCYSCVKKVRSIKCTKWCQYIFYLCTQWWAIPLADYTIRIRVRKRRACKLSLNNILRTFWQVFGLKEKIMFVFAVLSLKKHAVR